MASSIKQFHSELKQWRLRHGATQGEIAGAIGVSRATIAQWEAGKHLPSTANVRLLDDYLNAGEHLFNLAEKEREPLRQRASNSSEVRSELQRISVGEVFRKIGTGLVSDLVSDEQGRPLGWRQSARQQQRSPTPLSTAYGIKTMLIVGEPFVDFHELERTLLANQLPQGGWASHSRKAPRPESTAIILDALFRIGTSLPVEEATRLLENTLDEFNRGRPYILATALETIVRISPDSPLTLSLIEDLLATRLNFHGVFLWPEKVGPGLALQEPSAVHTARAVVALQAAARFHPTREDIQDALGQAREWLVSQPNKDGNKAEEIFLPADGAGEASLLFRHFAPAWVIQALTGSDQVPVERVRNALAKLWSRYDPESGMWAWDNGDLPIWMTHDAVVALRAASFALRSSAV